MDSGPEDYSKYYSLIKQDQEKEKSDVNAVISDSTDHVAAENAKVLDLSEKSGIPSSIVDGVSEDVERNIKKQENENLNLSQKAPKLANQLKSDPVFARASQEDLKSLSDDEGTISAVLHFINPNPMELGRQAYAGYVHGGIVNDLQQKYMQQGYLSSDDKKTLDDAKKEIASLGEPDSVVGILGNLAGTLVPLGLKVPKYGLAGAAIGATSGGASGATGGAIVAGVPTAGVGAPEGAVAGGAVGAVVGGAAGLAVGSYAGLSYATSMMYAGDTYIDLLNEGVDPDVARDTALTVGGIMGLLETGAVGSVLRRTGVTKPIQSAVTHKLGDTIKKYTVSTLLKDAGKMKAEQIGLLQAESTVQMIGQETALSLSNKETHLDTPQGQEKLIDDWFDRLESNTKMGVSIGLAGSALNTRHLGKVRNISQQQMQGLMTLKELSDISEAKKKSVAVFKKFLENQLGGETGSTLYIRANTFNNLLEKHGVSRADLGVEVKNNLGESTAEVGGDVTISTADFLAKIADTKFGEELMQHVRLEQRSMSPVEINEHNELSNQVENNQVENNQVENNQVSSDIAVTPETSFSQFLEQAGNKFLLEKEGSTSEVGTDFLAEYEKYLYDSNSVNQSNIGLYRDFTNFLLDANKKNELNLSPEIKEKLNRIATVYEAIDNADIESIIDPAKKTRTQLLNEKDLAEYEKLLAEAKEQAIEEILNQSFNDFTWLNKAMSKEGRKITRENKKTENIQRKKEVEKANKLKIYNVTNVLKYGIPNEDGTRTRYKISLDSINELFEESPEKLAQVKERLGYGRYGMLAKDGASVHEVALFADYKSATSFMNTLLKTEHFDSYVERKTRESLSRNKDYLNTNEAVENAINVALNNKTRIKFNAIELKALAKIDKPASELIDKAFHVALNDLNSTKVGDLNVNKITKTINNINRDIYKASLKGDLNALIDAKQKQLVLGNLLKLTDTTKKKIDAFLNTKKRFFDPDKKISKMRSIDEVNKGRQVLVDFDLGNKNKSASDKLNDLTVTQALGLIDGINANWELARQANTVTLYGKKLDLQKTVNNLLNSAREFKNAKDPKKISEARKNLADYGYRYIRMEFLSSIIDDGKHGVFTQTITDPVMQSVTKYNIEKKRILEPLTKGLEALGIKRGVIEAPELSPDFAFENKFELLSALLYSGSEDGLRKMVLGRGWGKKMPKGEIDLTKWNSFLDRMFEDGVLDKSHMDWVQSVFDSFDDLLPDMKHTFKYLNGYDLKEITPIKIKTPFGDYKGGYSPIKYIKEVQAEISRGRETANLKEALNTDLADYNNSMPFDKNPSFTEERTGFIGEVDFDLQGVMGNFNKVIKFTHIAPRIFDVHKIITDADFAREFEKLHPNKINEVIKPWLDRVMKQTIVTSMPAFSSGVFKHIKASSSLSFLAHNLGNTFEQLSNLVTVSRYVKMRDLASTTLDYVKLGRNELKEKMYRLSDFMKIRDGDGGRLLMHEFEDCFLPPSNRVHQAGRGIKNYFRKNGLFLQHYFAREMGIVSWNTAFDRAFLENSKIMPERKAQRLAVAEADKVVRQSLESFTVESSAEYQRGNQFHQAIIQFSQFFNGLGNFLYSESAITRQRNTLERLKENKQATGNNDPKSAYEFTRDIANKNGRELKRLSRYFPAFVRTYLVLAMGEGINRLFRNGQFVAKDKDGEDSYFDTFVLPIITGLPRAFGAAGNYR